ncbi:hypothetical protein [Paludisphaera mucosa]|uniref:Uncharacterized protein n=1 Tax=Paludisphaera mucosa TaxID=3030827 RepID=A0ABT6FDL6_9BACT|nr:hypothetical protein [Paludisphaera mucosa]MDG3005627.1 hypothetical protein [Paludisphaera mucosa]
MTPLLAPSNDATARFDDDGFEWGLTLIQVPDVGPACSRTSPVESWERTWAERRRSHGPALRTRPRRRLRREFRVAACVCLAFAPIVTAFGAWGFPPVRRAAAAEVASASRPADEDEASPWSIRLSIKPAESEPETPVVFPGYLLPAERREEPSHEGS